MNTVMVPHIGTEKMERTVRIADLAVMRGNAMLVTTGLGSCVGIALFSRATRIGALAHVLLPAPSMTSGEAIAGKYASTAVPDMVKRMRALGATGPIEARLIGGASMFAALLPPDGVSLGARNVAAAEAACAVQDIAVVGRDVGGGHGRSIYFDVADGTVLVRSIQMGNVVL